jgi:hypothetical protein
MPTLWSNAMDIRASDRRLAQGIEREKGKSTSTVFSASENLWSFVRKSSRHNGSTSQAAKAPDIPTLAHLQGDAAPCPLDFHAEPGEPGMLISHRGPTKAPGRAGMDARSNHGPPTGSLSSLRPFEVYRSVIQTDRIILDWVGHPDRSILSGCPITGIQNFA